MSQSQKNRSIIWRVVSAAVIALVLWSVTSLSGNFVWTLAVPLTIELRPDQALVHPVPRFIDVTLSASGWSLMILMVRGGAVCTIYPRTAEGSNEYLERVGERELLENIRSTIAKMQLLRVVPDSLALRIGPVGSKKVPLVANVRVNMRKGFQVVGRLRLEPDSVLLTGSTRALAATRSWPTAPILIEDVHRPISRQLRVSDTIAEVIRPATLNVSLAADVQEVAERSFPDILVLNRGTVRDTTLQLVMQPPRVEILVRGGARDLTQLDPQSLVAYINVIEGVDTLGVATPRLMPLSGFTIVSVQPKRIRYMWRRVVVE